MNDHVATVAVFTSIARAERSGIGASYDELADRLGAPASVRWSAVSAWWRHRPGVTPCLVILRRGSCVVAAAALATSSRRPGIHVTKAGVGGEPFALLYNDEATGRALAKAITDTLRDLGVPWSLGLHDLVDDGPATQHLTTLLGASPRIEHTTPVLDVRDVAGVARQPSRNTRQAVAKARNRIAREGHRLQVEWSEDPDRVGEVVPDLLNLHRRRNEQLRGSSLLSIPWQRSLFTETVLGHAGAGRLRLLCIGIDDALAAFAVVLVTGDTWWAYSNYADANWLRYSPGTIANAEVVRAAQEAPDVSRVDWGSGVQRYKMSGGASLEPRWSVDTASSGLILGARRARLELEEIAIRLRRRGAPDPDNL